MDRVRDVRPAAEQSEIGGERDRRSAVRGQASVTSSRVSDRWIWTPSPFRAARRATSASNSGPQLYGACGP
jgi:hypothetical protein